VSSAGSTISRELHRQQRGLLSDRVRRDKLAPRLRYLTERTRRTSRILPQRTGFTEQEMQDYFTFAHNAYDSYLSTGNDAVLQRRRQ